MGFAGALTLGAIVAALASLAFTRWSPDIVLLGAVVVLMVGGVLGPEQALAGFSNPGLLTVAALFVVAAGVRETGAVAQLVGVLLGRPKTLHSALARLVAPVVAASAFLNNTPVVAAYIPALRVWARQSGFPVSRFLLPLSFASVLGGTCTLIGTSTNLVVAGLVLEAMSDRSDLHALGIFEISRVGLPVAMLGGLYLVLLGPRLLPDRKPPISLTDDPREYTAELVVEQGSPLAGKSIEEAGLRNLPGAYVAELSRGERVIAAVGPAERLEEGDRLVFVGILDSVVDLQRTRGLAPADSQVWKLEGPRDRRNLVEVVVSRENPMLNRTIRAGRFRTRYDAVVVAVARHGARLRGKIGDLILREGDVLLLEANPGFTPTHRDRRDFYLVSQVEDSAPFRHERAPVAMVILGAMVGLVAVGATSMLLASFVAAVAMIVARCVDVSTARRSIDWTVLIAIGAALGMGRAMQASGLDEGLASMVLDMAGGRMWMSLVAVYVVTVLLTELVTNNAAAALAFPLVLSVADQLGVSPMPFVIVIMMGASASFITPIGYQTNLMVYGPGGYRFGDYLRLGLPLALMVGCVTLLLAPLLWPF